MSRDRLGRRRLLVTGGDGFVGRAIKEFLADQWEVTAPGRRELDVTSRFGIAGRFDHVLHAAGLSGVMESWQRISDFLTVNVCGTANALEYCREHGCSMTFLSSYVYGTGPTGPVSESCTPAPNSPYSLSKHLAEQCCEFHSRNFGIPVTVLRVFNVYGPGQSQRFLIPSVIAQALDAERGFVEVQDLTPRRDYVFVSDVISAFASTAGLPGFHLYNVGTGVSHSVSELVRLVLRQAGVEKMIRSQAASRTNEVADVRADISALRHDVGWRPEITLEAGIALMIESFGKR